MIDPKATVAIVAIVAGTSVFLSIVNAFGKWLGRPKPGPLSTERDVERDVRMQRIEDALESIAIEVERIGEGQRFTTKLLGERNTQAQSAPVARDYPRVTTPH